MQSTPEILVRLKRLNTETDQKRELSEIPEKKCWGNSNFFRSNSSLFTDDSFPIYFDRFPHFFDPFTVLEKVKNSQFLFGFFYFSIRFRIFLVRFRFSKKFIKVKLWWLTNSVQLMFVFLISCQTSDKKRNWIFATNSDFLTSISFQPNLVDLLYFKLIILLELII